MKIKFIAPNSHVMQVREKPLPASKFIPEWWKQMSPHMNNKFDLTPQPNATAKKCFPLLDGITAGYIVTLWADLLVTQRDGAPYVKWATDVNVLEVWSSKQSYGYEIPEGYNETVFKYQHGWVIETPKNYSCLITHPIGYPNIPIRTLSGIIDTDSLKTFANSPFVIKEGFEGIIEKGTPMFQVVPIKREPWVSKFESYTSEQHMYSQEKNIAKTIVNNYIKNIWQKKEYK